MWHQKDHSRGWYHYNRLPGKQAPPWNHPSDGNQRLINVVPKRPPLGDKRSSRLARPNEAGYSRYYCHVDYQEWDKGRCFTQDPRRAPPYKRGHYGYRWSRDEYSTRNSFVVVCNGISPQGFRETKCRREGSTLHKLLWYLNCQSPTLLLWSLSPMIITLSY
uniref:Uncharacterized protein n=1 Tax=Peromyscus maniculatus bairdii TaxID=230844 RepID=A0A8C8W863_PERMB